MPSLVVANSHPDRAVPSCPAGNIECNNASLQQFPGQAQAFPRMPWAQHLRCQKITPLREQPGACSAAEISTNANEQDKAATAGQVIRTKPSNCTVTIVRSRTDPLYTPVCTHDLWSIVTPEVPHASHTTGMMSTCTSTTANPSTSHTFPDIPSWSATTQTSRSTTRGSSLCPQALPDKAPPAATPNISTPVTDHVATSTAQRPPTAAAGTARGRWEHVRMQAAGCCLPLPPLAESCSILGLTMYPCDMVGQRQRCASLWDPTLPRGKRLPCLPIFQSYHLTVHATALRVWPEQTSSTCAAASVAAAWNTLCIPDKADSFQARRGAELQEPGRASEREHRLCNTAGQPRPPWPLFEGDVMQIFIADETCKVRRYPLCAIQPFNTVGTCHLTRLDLVVCVES